MRLCHHDRARCHYVKHGQTENRSFECSPLPAPRNLNSSTIATASTITSSPSTIATTFTSPSFAAIAAPATSTPGWSLVDEGQAKGVLKLGLASSVLGSVLRIGPLPGPPGAACAPLTARLGYLVSSTRQHMGAFHVACEGCLCFSSMHYYQDMYPFPEVQADALYSPDPTYMRHNVTLTASTEFTILWNATSECSLRITNTLADPFFVVKRKHRNVGARPITKPTDPSNVRIDSLQLSPLSRADMLFSRCTARSRCGQIARMRISSLGSIKSGKRNPNGKEYDLEATRMLLGLADKEQAFHILSSKSSSLARYLHVENPKHENYTHSPCSFAPCTDYQSNECI